jgi:AhpD family alkylhydroperoxidase
MTPKLSRERPVMNQSTIRLYGLLSRLESEIKLDATVRELVKVRASQINRCVFCIDMHWKDARGAGESEERLYSLAAWRESPLYSERERAALALCEAITLIDSAGVPDDVWEQAAEWFQPEEMAHLVFAITAINSWNRLTIAARTEPRALPAATARGSGVGAR